MRFGIRTLDEVNVAGKTVLCRVDINQPIDRSADALKSIHRIESCVPTLREISDAGARLVVLAHQGSDIEYKNFYCTRPHAKVLSQLLGREVKWVEDVCGPTARAAIMALKDGEVLLLDNVRFCSEEQTLFEEKLKLTHEQQAGTEVVRKLAPLADLYVNDAFAAAHRDQPTLCGFEQLLPSAMGRLFEREYCVISELMENPARPCVFVLGGAKVSDAFLMMETVLKNGAADQVITGGLVGEILLASQGAKIGEHTVEYIKANNYGSLIERCREIYARYRDKITLPEDLAYLVDGKRVEAAVGQVPAYACALDIGTKTAKRYVDVILDAKTVFVNGPMGVFEQAQTELGTKVVWNALAETAAHTVVGGGDSVTAVGKYRIADRIDYICTGGGALIRFLTGEELPVVKALRHGSNLPLK